MRLGGCGGCELTAMGIPSFRSSASYSFARTGRNPDLKKVPSPGLSCRNTVHRSTLSKASTKSGSRPLYYLRLAVVSRRLRCNSTSSGHWLAILGCHVALLHFGADASAYSQAQLDQVALRLNQRPRKTSGFQIPASKLQARVASTV